MSSRHFGLALAVVTSLAGCGQFIGGSRVHREEIVSQTFETSPNPLVAVDLFRGSIRVMGHDKHVVEANVTKRAGGRTAEIAWDNLEDILVTFDQEGDRVTIVAECADRDSLLGEQDLSAGVELLKVPMGASIVLQTSMGAVSVEAVAGSIEVSNSNGAISVEGCQEKVTLTSSFGELTIEGSSPDVQATTSNGAIRLSQHGPSKLNLKSSFGGIYVDADSTLELHAKTDNGPIHVTAGAQGSLDVRTSFGEVKIDSIQSTVTARTDNGSIEVTNQGEGKLELESHFGSIAAAGDGILLDARTDNGSIEFEGILATGENRLQTHFGSIELRIPEGAALAVQARTSFGKIESEFELLDLEPGSRSFRRGTIGELNEDVLVNCSLRTDNGVIRIKKK